MRLFYVNHLPIRLGSLVLNQVRAYAMKLDMWKVTAKKRLAQEATNQLKNLILQGSYKPGEKLPPERKLAEKFGINRATLREALKDLEHLGLVRIRQGDGTRVLDFFQTAGLDLLRHLLPLNEEAQLGLLRDILEFRQIIGRELAKLAAERTTEQHLEMLREIASRKVGSPSERMVQDLDFYVELGRASKNMVFLLLLNSVRSAVRNVSRLFSDLNPPAEEVMAHHAELIDALAKGDQEEAYRIADLHLSRGKEHFLEIISSGPVIVSWAQPAASAQGEEIP
jgi:GntR family transcriptional regulator, transcriptional repressor for pyruvate dehydrogenase complex